MNDMICVRETKHRIISRMVVALCLLIFRIRNKYMSILILCLFVCLYNIYHLFFSLFNLIPSIHQPIIIIIITTTTTTRKHNQIIIKRNKNQITAILRRYFCILFWLIHFKKDIYVGVSIWDMIDIQFFV